MNKGVETNISKKSNPIREEIEQLLRKHIVNLYERIPNAKQMLGSDYFNAIRQAHEYRLQRFIKEFMSENIIDAFFNLFQIADDTNIHNLSVFFELYNRNFIPQDHVISAFKYNYTGSFMPFLFHRDNIINFFEKHRGQFITEQEEISFLNSLPSKIKIYRGIDRKISEEYQNWAWTTDEKVAIKFAKHYNDPIKIALADPNLYKKIIFKSTSPILLTGVIKKKDIIAVFTDRNESEVIVNPKHIRDLSEIQL